MFWEVEMGCTEVKCWNWELTTLPHSWLLTYIQLHWLLILIDLRKWPFWISNFFFKQNGLNYLLSWRKIRFNQYWRRQLTSVSMIAAFIAWCNLTSIGLWQVCWGLNFPSRKQSNVQYWHQEPNIFITSFVSLYNISRLHGICVDLQSWVLLGNTQGLSQRASLIRICVGSKYQYN